MFSEFDADTSQMLIGNLLLVGCCIFYLLWWIIAFKPVRPIKGFKSGWLVIPALILGVLSIVFIVRGSCFLDDGYELLIPKWITFVGGIVVYIALLAATSIFLHRQVTTELFLIIGWLVIMFLEISALYALGDYGLGASIAWLIICSVAAVVSLICYLLYYNLDAVKGYVDGMIPLVLLGGMMVAVTISVCV
ncbi:MAG: hypothetical protein LUB61_02735 [Eggerthellaceae bacterium]|nr:hypothetical protein [Eggerthellaceae bacterium]